MFAEWPAKPTAGTATGTKAARPVCLGGGLRTPRLAALDPLGGKSKQQGLSCGCSPADPGPSRRGLRPTDRAVGLGAPAACVAAGEGSPAHQTQSPTLGVILLSSSKARQDRNVLSPSQFLTGLGPHPPGGHCGWFRHSASQQKHPMCWVSTRYRASGSHFCPKPTSPRRALPRRGCPSGVHS